MSTNVNFVAGDGPVLRTNVDNPPSNGRTKQSTVIEAEIPAAAVPDSSIHALIDESKFIELDSIDTLESNLPAPKQAVPSVASDASRLAGSGMGGGSAPAPSQPVEVGDHGQQASGASDRQTGPPSDTDLPMAAGSGVTGQAVGTGADAEAPTSAQVDSAPVVADGAYDSVFSASDPPIDNSVTAALMEAELAANEIVYETEEDRFGVSWQEVAVHFAMKNGNLQRRDDGQVDVDAALAELSKRLTSRGPEGYGDLRDQAFTETAREHPEWIGPVAEGIGEGFGGGYDSQSGSGCSGSVTETSRSIEREDVNESWVSVASGEWTWSDDSFRFTSTWSSPPAGTQIYTVEYQYLEYDWDTSSFGTNWQQLGPGAGSPNYPLETSSMPWGWYWIVGKATLSGLCPGTVCGTGRFLNVAEIQFTEFFGITQGGGATDPASTNFYPGGNPDSVDDGYPSTQFHETPFNMGAGDRYDWGQNTPSGTLHDRVGLRVRVVPNVSGIPVHIRLIDPDDPTDSNGPIDDDSGSTPSNCDAFGFCDNHWMDQPIEASRQTVATSGTHAQYEGAFVMNEGHPGDNFRLVIAQRGGSANHLDRIKPVVPDNFGRSFYDLNNNGTRESQSEPMLTETTSVLITGNHFYSLPLLTIWRTLHVERDSMGPPPAGVPGFGPADPHPRPAISATGAMPAPDTSYFANQGLHSG